MQWSDRERNAAKGLPHILTTPEKPYVRPSGPISHHTGCVNVNRLPPSVFHRRSQRVALEDFGAAPHNLEKAQYNTWCHTRRVGATGGGHATNGDCLTDGGTDWLPR